METSRITNTPDDVFRTLLNDCSPLIIPMLNKEFGEQYSGNEKIIFSPNEHFLNQKGGNEEERITDSIFRIQGKVTKNAFPQMPRIYAGYAKSWQRKSQFFEK